MKAEHTHSVVITAQHPIARQMVQFAELDGQLMTTGNLEQKKGAEAAPNLVATENSPTCKNVPCRAYPKHQRARVDHRDA